MKLASNTPTKNLKPNDRLDTLEAQSENLNMAVRITQALLKQMMEQHKPMQDGLRSTTSMVNDFQYRVLAMQELLNVDVAALTAKADELKLKDWQTASDRDDAERGFTVADKVESAEDVVVISSLVGDASNVGIFRSKMVLAETGNPELVEGLIGKSPGFTMDAKIGEDTHKVTLLAVRKQPVQTEVPQKETIN